MKCGLIYGSCTGRTEEVAEMIASALKPEIELELKDVNSIEASELPEWQFLLCGIPTWDIGELEYGWQDIYDKLDSIDLTGLTVALFGLGDQHGYPDTYQDAMGILYLKLLERGARGGFGFTDTTSHEFKESKALVDGCFCGLAIDEDCQQELTEERIAAWALEIKAKWAQISQLREASV